MNLDKLTNKSRSINIPSQQRQSSSPQRFGHESNQREKIIKSTCLNSEQLHTAGPHHHLNTLVRPKVNGPVHHQTKTTPFQIKGDGHQMSTDIQHQQSLLIIVRSQAASIRVSEAKAKAVKISYHTDQTDQVIVQTSSRLTDGPTFH